RGVLNEAVAKARTILNVRFESDSTALILQLVESGSGYAILPLSYLDGLSKERLSFTSIVKPLCHMSIYLAWRNHRIDNSSVLKMDDKVMGRIIQDIFVKFPSSDLDRDKAIHETNVPSCNSVASAV